ncbi:hypothetical protein AVEN_220359-1, partial [Araneus ventricosus]
VHGVNFLLDAFGPQSESMPCRFANPLHCVLDMRDQP